MAATGKMRQITKTEARIAALDHIISVSDRTFDDLALEHGFTSEETDEIFLALDDELNKLRNKLIALKKKEGIF